jgi:lactoylglutathione lyase
MLSFQCMAPWIIPQCLESSIRLDKTPSGHYFAPVEDRPTITLNLVVLRSPDIARAAAFYSRLGLQFAKHRHGNGVEHYAAELPGGVFELYPLAPEGPSTLGTRIGFRVPSVDAALAALSDYPGAVVTPARDSEWGRRAVVADPDGHRVELVQGT